MMADTTEELLAAAAALGLKPEWIQNKGQATEHFDVCQSKATQAVLKLGAVHMDAKDMIRQIVWPRRKQKGG